MTTPTHQTMGANDGGLSLDMVLKDSEIRALRIANTTLTEEIEKLKAALPSSDPRTSGEPEVERLRRELEEARKTITNLEAARAMDRELLNIASQALVRAGLVSLVRRDLAAVGPVRGRGKQITAGDRSQWIESELVVMKYHGPGRIIESARTLESILGVKSGKGSKFFDGINDRVHSLDLSDPNSVALFVHGSRQIGKFQEELEDLMKTATPTNPYWYEESHMVFSPTMRPRAHTAAKASSIPPTSAPSATPPVAEAPPRPASFSG